MTWTMQIAVEEVEKSTMAHIFRNGGLYSTNEKNEKAWVLVIRRCTFATMSVSKIE